MPALLLFAVATLVGCAPTLPPAVSVNNTRVLESTDQGVRLAVDLVFENPNDFPLKLERVAYQVAVPDAALLAYAGDELPARTLPANGLQTVTLTAGLAGLAEGADRAGAGLSKGLAEGLAGGVAEGLAEGLAGVLGAQAKTPHAAWTVGAAAGQVWQVRGDVIYAADRGLRTFLTETGVPLPVAGFYGDGRFADELPR